MGEGTNANANDGRGGDHHIVGADDDIDVDAKRERVEAPPATCRMRKGGPSVGDQYSDRACGECEDAAFGQELANQAESALAGATRMATSRPACSQAGKQQIADIRRRTIRPDKHEAGRNECNGRQRSAGLTSARW